MEILPGFPERVRGRLVFVPKDNLNTDAIYPGSYTYRDDVTPEMMAEVAFSNYDPQFPQSTRAGDVIVGGANFGTGSSREQAATSLKAKGFPLVIAASFSQTYLRNAFNNGFLCIEIPELVKRLKANFGTQIAAGEKTIIPGDEIAIDFTRGVVTWRGEAFPLSAARKCSTIIGRGGRRGKSSVEAPRVSAKMNTETQRHREQHPYVFSVSPCLCVGCTLGAH